MKLLPLASVMILESWGGAPHGGGGESLLSGKSASPSGPLPASTHALSLSLK